MKKILFVMLLAVLFAVPPMALGQTPQQKTTKIMTLTVANPLVISTVSPLPPGFVGQAYSVQFTATGGTGAITWTVPAGSILPGGLTLSATGLLSGTLTTGGTFTFSVTATDSGVIATLQIKTSNIVASK